MVDTVVCSMATPSVTVLRFTKETSVKVRFILTGKALFTYAGIMKGWKVFSQMEY